MTYRGIVKRGLIELEGEVTLAEGTRVSVTPEEPLAIDSRTSALDFGHCPRNQIAGKWQPDGGFIAGA